MGTHIEDLILPTSVGHLLLLAGNLDMNATATGVFRAAWEERGNGFSAPEPDNLAGFYSQAA